MAQPHVTVTYQDDDAKTFHCETQNVNREGPKGSMATPTKRRKPNGFKASPQMVGSLDFFFGKQKEEKVAKATNENGLLDELNHTPGLTPEDRTHDATAQALADEKLARKLQSEWCTEISSHDEVEELKVKASLRINDSEQPTWNPVITEQQLSTNSGPKEEGRYIEEPKAELAHKTPETLSLQSASSSKDLISSSIPFDISPLTFDTSLYLPDLKRHWATEGGDASYGLLTRCFVLVNATQSRIKIVDTLVNFLRTIIEGDPGSLLPAVSVPITNSGLMMNNATGLAGYKCHITALHIVRAWPGGLSHIQSVEKNVWFR